MCVCTCLFACVVAIIIGIDEGSARNGKLQICAQQTQRIVNYCNFYEFTQI